MRFLCGDGPVLPLPPRFVPLCQAGNRERILGRMPPCTACGLLEAAPSEGSDEEEDGEEGDGLPGEGVPISLRSEERRVGKEC